MTGIGLTPVPRAISGRAEQDAARQKIESANSAVRRILPQSGSFGLGLRWRWSAALSPPPRCREARHGLTPRPPRRPRPSRADARPRTALAPPGRAARRRRCRAWRPHGATVLTGRSTSATVSTAAPPTAMTRWIRGASGAFRSGALPSPARSSGGAAEETADGRPRLHARSPRRPRAAASTRRRRPRRGIRAWAARGARGGDAASPTAPAAFTAVLPARPARRARRRRRPPRPSPPLACASRARARRLRWPMESTPCLPGNAAS